MTKYNLEIYNKYDDEIQLWSFNPLYPDDPEVWTGSLTKAKKLKKLLEELGTDEELTIVEAED